MSLQIEHKTEKGTVNKKLTRGQKREIERLNFNKRLEDIYKHGFYIEEYCVGSRIYIENCSYALFKNNKKLHNGVYNTETQCVIVAENIINETKNETHF